MGLAWKSDRKKEAALGLMKKIVPESKDGIKATGNWFYSSTAMDILKRFIVDFPDIIEALQKTDNKRGIFEVVYFV